MDVAPILSTEEASLILQLIEFAEANDFFESESNDENEGRTYQELHQLTCGLKKRLPAVGGSDGKKAAVGKAVNVGKHTMIENDRPWWDVSEVKLGLKPFELRKRVKELCDELAGLIFYSNSLEARQSMLEVVHMLQFADRSVKASASSDAGEAPTSR